MDKQLRDAIRRTLAEMPLSEVSDLFSERLRTQIDAEAPEATDPRLAAAWPDDLPTAGGSAESEMYRDIADADDAPSPDALDVERLARALWVAAGSPEPSWDANMDHHFRPHAAAIAREYLALASEDKR